MHAECVFSGTRQKLETQDFLGGKVTTIFGGAEIDLRSVGTKREEVSIKAEAVFGGIEIVGARSLADHRARHGRVWRIRGQDVSRRLRARPAKRLVWWLRALRFLAAWSLKTDASHLPEHHQFGRLHGTVDASCGRAGSIDPCSDQSELEPVAIRRGAAVHVLRLCVPHAVVHLPRTPIGIGASDAIVDQPTGGGCSRLHAMDRGCPAAGFRDGPGLATESRDSAVSGGRLIALSDVGRAALRAAGGGGLARSSPPDARRRTARAQVPDQSALPVQLPELDQRADQHRSSPRARHVRAPLGFPAQDAGSGRARKHHLARRAGAWRARIWKSNRFDSALDCK